MTEQAVRELAALLGGEAVPRMPSSLTWDVLIERAEGLLAAIEDQPGWIYRNREVFRSRQAEGDPIRSSRLTSGVSGTEARAGLRA